MKRGDLYAIYRPCGFYGGKWLYKLIGMAKVLGVIDGYAMLRFKGALPFVESVKTLERWKVSPPPLDERVAVG